MVTGSRPHSTDLTATKHPSHPTPPTPFQIHAPPSNPIPVSTPPRRKSTSFHPYDMVHTRLPAPATHSMSCSVPNSATFANRELDAAYPGPSNASYPVSRNAEDALMDYLFDPETPASRSGSGSGTSGSLPTEVRNRIPEWQEQLNSLFLQSMNVKSRIL
ncbi:hypothetical protein BJ741DRAFT_589217 [Chytriomyces cf. hyalinus JEL632]|nr:hypothetical protein BJ741DRAFT_589217 [Chytriomyces cf. hyalinus JEL632]